jgi:hypothetical protein
MMIRPDRGKGAGYPGKACADDDNGLVGLCGNYTEAVRLKRQFPLTDKLKAAHEVNQLPESM